MPDPEIVNAVGGGNLDQELDLQLLHNITDGHEVRYDPEYWPGLYIRFNSESPAILVFRTGKYNIAGADSVEELLNANGELISYLHNIGIGGDEPSFEIRNLVFLDRYRRELDLEHIAVALGLEDTEYEPEQFPGLLFRPQNHAGTFLIFMNGKILLTGAKRSDDAVEAFKNLFGKLDRLFE